MAPFMRTAKSTLKPAQGVDFDVIADMSDNHRINPIWLFLPYIEPVSNSENVQRLLGHVLMETEIHLTAYTFCDSLGEYDSLTTYEKQVKGNCFELQTQPTDALTIQFGSYLQA